MALSAALHHSRVVGPESYEAPLGLMTDRAEGGGPQGGPRPTGTDATSSRTRPEQLPAAPGPHLAAVTVGYVATGAPSLVVAPVAAHDGLDLLQQYIIDYHLCLLILS